MLVGNFASLQLIHLKDLKKNRDTLSLYDTLGFAILNYTTDFMSKNMLSALRMTDFFLAYVQIITQNDCSKPQCISSDLKIIMVIPVIGRYSVRMWNALRNIYLRGCADKSLARP